MAIDPQASVSGTYATWGQAHAAYLALNNPRVTSSEIRRALQQSCLEALDPEQLVLVLQDTSTFEFNSHPATVGLGPTASAEGAAAGHGFHLHTALAVTSSGVPLGIVHQQIKVRDPEKAGCKHERKQRPIKEKESYRWLETSEATHKAVPASQPMLQVADREGDIFELLAEPRRPNSFILIRSAHDRSVVCGQSKQRMRLSEVVQQTEFSGSYLIEVGRKPGQQPRDALLSVRFAKVTVQVPRHGVHDPQLEPVELTVIEAVETAAPPADCKPIRWLLFTDLPVTSLEQAITYVGYYGRRWLIERYHFALKSGCRIESSELKTFKGLERLLAMYCVVALRIMHMAYLSRTSGQQPCTVLFTDLEWQVLHRYHNPKTPLPPQPPTLHQAVVWTARLGGFLARKGDGEPGLKVLWRGLTRLHDMVLSLMIFAPQLDVYKA